MDFERFHQNLLQVPHISILGHVIGLLGMASIVVAYYMIESGRLNRDDSKYYLFNLAGAILLEMSLIINFNLGSFVIEIFWIAISLVGLRRIQRQKKDQPQSDDLLHNSSQFNSNSAATRQIKNL